MKKDLAFFIIIALFFACNSQSKQEEKTLLNVAGGKVERIENFQSKYISPRNVDVWLPEEYDSSERYAVLYMHDGQMLYDSTTTWNKQEWGVDEVMLKLMDKGEIQQAIVVGIWNVKETRHPDYFPQKPFESLPQELQDSLINRSTRSGGR